jgi:hypothetical protein
VTDLEVREYSSLRRTIQQRGTLRAALLVATIGVWAALWVVILVVLAVPVATVGPLVVLFAGFEAVFAVHMGVERVGRYLQVAYEEAREMPLWETLSMRYSTAFTGAGLDPLFLAVFATAGLVNTLPAVVSGATVPELVVLGGLHGVWLLRLAVARQMVRQQRAVDLDRFRTLLSRVRTPTSP